MPVGDVYKVAYVCTLRGHTMVNTFHYLVSQANTTGTPEYLIASRFEAQVAVLLQRIQSNQVLQERIEVQRIFPGPRLVRQDFTLSGTGQEPTAAVPDAVALVLRRRTKLAGRSYRGRIFVGGVGLQYFNGTTGRWTTGSNNFLSLAAGGLATDLIDSATTMRLAPIIRGRSGLVLEYVTASAFDPIPRSQRRRQLDVGA